MTLTLLKGIGPIWYDEFLDDQSGAPTFTGTAVDTADERFALVGKVWHPTTKTGTINLRKIHFPAGAVTQGGAATSTYRLSLQTLSATAGPPYQPDGTQDQTADFVGGTNAVSANAWNTTPNLSADRAVDLGALNIGDANSPWLGVVGQWSAFQSGDSVVMNTIQASLPTSPGRTNVKGIPLFHNGTSWSTVASVMGVVAFECDDGSKAFLRPYPPISAFGSTSIASNGAVRAAGLYFRVPVELAISRIGLKLLIPNGCTGSLILYDTDGTTPLRSYSVDDDAVLSATANRILDVEIAPRTLTANSFYRLAFEAGTTTAATLATVSVDAAALMDGLRGGQDFQYTERDSGGTWTQTATKRPIFLIEVESVHDGAGGSGDTGGLRRFNAGYN